MAFTGTHTSLDGLAGRNVLDFMGKRNRDLAGINNRFSGSEYPLVGMNASLIPEVKSAIEEYLLGINKILNQINTEISSTHAFKGEEITAAVEKYLTSVKDYAQNLVSQLKAFEDKLTEANTAWNNSIKSLAGNITQIDSGTAYTTKS